MKESPLLMSGVLVRATLADMKTMTRRLMKEFDPPLGTRAIPADVAYLPDFTCYRSTCPYGQPGDRIWIREECWIYGRWEVKGVRKNGKPSWRFVPIGQRVSFTNPGLDEPHAYWGGGEGWAWKPSIHMPRWACRLFLEVTGVRVERLQEITDADALAEGTPCHVCGECMDGRAEHDCHCFHRKAKAHDFELLWERINGAGSWAANPWVWVIEYRRIET